MRAKRHLPLLLLLACSSNTPLSDAGPSGDVLESDAQVDGVLDVADARGDTPSLHDAGPDVPLPEAPEWEPPFPLAEGGWRDSSEPMCDEFSGDYTAGFRVWSDVRGVFVFISQWTVYYPGPAERLNGSALWHNDGSGWVNWWSTNLRVAGSGDMAGAPGGPIYLFNGWCRVRAIEGPGRVRCVLEGLLPSDGTQLGQTVNTTRDEVWLLQSDRAVRFVDGALGRELFPPELLWPESPRQLFAAEDSVAMVTNDALYVHDGTSFEPRGDLHEFLEGSPSDAELVQIWVNNMDDLWLSTRPGSLLLHYNGTEWTEIETGLNSVISQLWGNGEVLYFASSQGFGKWSEAGGVEIVAEWEDRDVTIHSIHGDAASGDLFLAISDKAFGRYRCGQSFVVWYDGTELRRF